MSTSKFHYYFKLGCFQFHSTQCIICNTALTIDSMNVFDIINGQDFKPNSHGNEEFLFFNNVCEGSEWFVYLKKNMATDEKMCMIAVDDNFISHEDPSDIDFYDWEEKGFFETDGTLGIFDYSYFDDDNIIKKIDAAFAKTVNPHILWYRYVNKQINDNDWRASIVPHGAGVTDLDDKSLVKVDVLIDKAHNKLIGIKLHFSQESINESYQTLHEKGKRLALERQAPIFTDYPFGPQAYHGHQFDLTHKTNVPSPSPHHPNFPLFVNPPVNDDDDDSNNWIDMTDPLNEMALMKGQSHAPHTPHQNPPINLDQLNKTLDELTKPKRILALLEGDEDINIQRTEEKIMPTDYTSTVVELLQIKDKGYVLIVENREIKII